MSLVIMKNAEISDVDFILKYDEHIKSEVLIENIKLKRVFIIRCGNTPCGFLRYSLFWDNTPFLNMMFLLEEYRKKGFGKISLGSWERKMQLLGFEMVLTSTLSNESSQHFYRKYGYRDCGSILFDQEPLEIIFKKHI